MIIAVKTRAMLGVILLGIAASTAAAAEPLLVRKFVDITVPQPQLSALCGFSVYRRIDGFVDAALFFDDDGNPLREIDTSPSLRRTFFSPDTGKSVSYPGTGTAITDYYADRSAIVTLDGFLTFVHVPGSGPLLMSVGRMVFSTVVIGTNSDGLPVTGPVIEILVEEGVDDGTILSACQALAL